MNSVKIFFEHGWKIVIGAFVFTAGLVAGRLLFHSIGLIPPRLPQQADESTALYYLLCGSILLSIGISPLARKLNGAFYTRFLILCIFFFACFAISVSLESAIYSSHEGYNLMILIFLLPVLLHSFTITILYDPKCSMKGFSRQSADFLTSRTPGEWTKRMIVSVLSFPVVYLFFGIIVSPLVADYYREDFGLVIPGIGTILTLQLFRSALFLLTTLPILIVWSGTRMQLMFMLGLAHFMFVFAYDIVLAYQLPAMLVLTHAIEILLDSMVYAWITVKLLYPELSPATGKRIRNT